MRPPHVILTLLSGTRYGLATMLSGLGVSVETTPLLRIEELPDQGVLDGPLRRLEEYAAVAVTSPRAARIVGAQTSESRRTSGGYLPPFWAVGPSTAQALRFSQATVRLPPDEAHEGSRGALRLADSMLRAGVGSPVLFPCGDPHRPELPDRLRGANVEVEEMVCYRSLLATPEQARSACQAGDIVVVGSSRVVRLLAESIPPANRPWLVAIGRTSAAEAMRAGWRSLAVASEPSAPRVFDLIRLLLAALA